MVKDKKVGDIVFHLSYRSQKVYECKITKVNEDSYDVVGATGREVKGIKNWHLYDTREEAMRQSTLDDSFSSEKE